MAVVPPRGERKEPLIVFLNPDSRPQQNTIRAHWARPRENFSIKVWDVETGNVLQTLPGHRADVYTVAFSPDGRWIASGSEDSTVKIWDGRSGELVHTFRGHTGIVTSVAFSPDDRRLISGSRDHTAKVWDVSKLGEGPNK